MNELIPVLTPWAGGRSHGHQRSRVTGQTMAQVSGRLRDMIALAGFAIVAEHDLAADLASEDYRVRPARLFLIADPRMVGRLIGAMPAAFVEAGWSIALFERPDRKVVIRWADPLAPLSRFAGEDLHRLGRELAMILSDIVDASLHILSSDIAP